MDEFELVKTLIKPIFYYYYRSKTNWNIACNKECYK